MDKMLGKVTSFASLKVDAKRTKGLDCYVYNTTKAQQSSSEWQLVPPCLVAVCTAQLKVVGAADC